MEIKPPHNLNLKLLKTIVPTEVAQQITHLAGPSQWWYLDQIFENKSPVYTVCFDHSGKLLATIANFDNKSKIRIFDLLKQKKIISFDPDYSVYSICFNPSANLLAIGSGDSKAHIFDLRQQKEIISFDHKHGIVHHVCFNHSENTLATISSYDKAHIFDLDQQKNIISFDCNNSDNTICSACFHNTGTLLAIMTYGNNPICVFDMFQHKKTISFNIDALRYFHCGSGSNMCFNHFGDLLAISSAIRSENKVCIFDLCQQKEIISFDHDNEICSIHFDSGNLLATSSYNSAHIFDLRQQRKIISFNHDDKVNTVCFNPSGNVLVTGSKDGKARIFARYDDCTLEQLQFKHALLAWLLIEKPNTSIDTIKKLLLDVAQKHAYAYDKLHKIWKTFPQNMQNAIWRTMHHRIQKYGKDTDHDCIIQ
jgi:WD40 repeat protein